MAVSLTFSAILARHIADINQCIAPSDLSTYADDLLQASLITFPIYQSAIAVTGRAPQEKIAALTAEVMTRLAHELSPHLFEALVAIIKKRNKELAFNLILEQSSKSCTDFHNYH